jgi:hypothetical protein
MEFNIVSRWSSEEKERNAYGKCGGRNGGEFSPHQRVVRWCADLMSCG